MTVTLPKPVLLHPQPFVPSLSRDCPYFARRNEMQPFDKLRANGEGGPSRGKKLLGTKPRRVQRRAAHPSRRNRGRIPRVLLFRTCPARAQAKHTGECGP